MPFLTNKPLPRRTVLRGLGATIALPLLDAIGPSVFVAGWSRSRGRLALPEFLCAERYGDGILDTPRGRAWV